MDYDPNNKSLLSNWFDPYTPTHVKAWAELRRKGIWPDSFLALMRKNGIHIDHYWEQMIRSKLCEAWVDHVIG